MGVAKIVDGSDVTSEVKVKDQRSTLASFTSCSDKDQHDIPGVNVHCKECGSLRFNLGAQGQGQGLYQRRAEKRSC